MLILPSKDQGLLTLQGVTCLSTKLDGDSQGAATRTLTKREPEVLQTDRHSSFTR